MLDQFLAWLNFNSPAVQAGATVVLVFITWSYAQVTRQALRQAQRQHLDAARPAIVFGLLTPGRTPIPCCGSSGS